MTRQQREMLEVGCATLAATVIGLCLTAITGDAIIGICSGGLALCLYGAARA